MSPGSLGGKERVSKKVSRAVGTAREKKRDCKGLTQSLLNGDRFGKRFPQRRVRQWVDESSLKNQSLYLLGSKLRGEMFFFSLLLDSM